ncbi:MAG TPA: hypothetical protein VF281_00730 [Candidatus Saccharimonadales bacterium]
MLNTLAHLGHDHSLESISGVTALDHCMPIIIGAGIIIAALIGIIVYLLASRTPKKKSVQIKSMPKKHQDR